MDEKLAKDIMLICKHHYASNYKDELDAMNAYYQKYYCCPDITVDHRFAIELFLKPAVEYFLSDGSRLRSFINSGLFERSCKEPLFMNENGATEFYDVLYYRLTSWLCGIQIKEKVNGQWHWLVDLSEYPEGHHDII